MVTHSSGVALFSEYSSLLTFADLPVVDLLVKIFTGDAVFAVKTVLVEHSVHAVGIVVTHCLLERGRFSAAARFFQVNLVVEVFARDAVFTIKPITIKCRVNACSVVMSLSFSKRSRFGAATSFFLVHIIMEVLACDAVFSVEAIIIESCVLCCMLFLIVCSLF